MSAPSLALSRAADALRDPGRPLRIGVPVALLLVLVLYLLLLWPWMTTWGATPEERVATLPGDELVPGATDQSTRAVTVHAPAPEVWRWLVQIGEDRAGFYSYSWLENLFGADIHNADVVHPEWQTLRAGELVRAIPDDYLGGVLPQPGWRVAAVEPGHWFVLRGWGLFLVEPVDAGTSRLLVRTRFRDPTWWGPVITRLAFGPVHFVMERRMLLGIRDRAEGRRTPPALAALATGGFVAAAVGVIALFARRERGHGWVALPALLLVAVTVGTGDLLAGIAGFVALGLVVIALPHLRRRWPALLPVPVAVLLVLLLAPDAYLAFGVAFAAAAAAVVVVLAGRGLRRPAPRTGPGAHWGAPGSGLPTSGA